MPMLTSRIGKTTQLPQMLLEDAIVRAEGSTVEIVCTQPRRIATRSAARRVAVERNEALRQTVGYAIKDDSQLPSNNGNITYCTTGILMSRLRNSPEQTMDSVTHIIVDEVHERDVLIDLLMVNLKDLIRDRKAAGKRTPQVVLMSATLDITLFSNYFGEKQEDGSIKPCHSITVPGRSFPIDVKYLDDILGEVKNDTKGGHWASLVTTPDVRKFLKADGLQIGEESQPGITQKSFSVSQTPVEIQTYAVDGTLARLHLICATIDHILRTTSEGGILVFLPGMREILTMSSLLQEPDAEINFIDTSHVKICQLHSQLEQSRDDVFDPLPPGTRKVILATNVAETSLTIPYVRYVVDSGLHREIGFDQASNTRSLQSQWISKSSSKQRAGRAGRIAKGHYYGMFSRARFESFKQVTVPELLRTDLQKICLEIKSKSPDRDIATMLAGAIQPPNTDAIRAAIQELKDLDALTEKEELTQLGSLLAFIPVHPAMGKLVILGIIFRCLEPMLILAALGRSNALHMSPPSPSQKEEAANAKKDFGRGTRSDHVSTIHAFRWARSIQWNPSFKELMAGKFLDAREFDVANTKTLDIEQVLVDSGLIPPTPVEEFHSGHSWLNENSNNLSLIRALVVAGNPKSIAVASRANILATSAESRFAMRWSSVNFVPEKLAKDDVLRQPELYVYDEVFNTGVARDGGMIAVNTHISPVIAAIFASRAEIRKSTSPSGKDQLLLNNFLPIDIRTKGAETGDAEQAQAIMDFRQALRKVQTKAFNSLSQLYGENSGRYLADDPGQDQLIDRLAHIIDLADGAGQNEYFESMAEQIDRNFEQDLDSETLGGD
jgi:ATP-dependent RNA helicase DHX36